MVAVAAAPQQPRAGKDPAGKAPVNGINSVRINSPEGGDYAFFHIGYVSMEYLILRFGRPDRQWIVGKSGVFMGVSELGM
jgi:hypothetical protein